MAGKKKLEVKTEDKVRLDIYIKKNSSLSRGKVQKIIDYKNVTVNGEPVKHYHQKVRKGDIIEYNEDIPDKYEVTRTEIPVDIIYEDEYLLAINKQPGLVVHPAPGHENDTLVNALVGKHIKEEACFGKNSRLGIVHRLDKDTTGIMVVAKNSGTFVKLSSIFKNREIEKFYKAIVHGKVEKEGRIETPINRDERNRKKFTARSLSGKNAQTIFTPKEKFYNSSLLEVKILTGRTHQIRVHMNFLKHEITGDPMYGDKTKDFQLLEYLGFDRKSLKDILPRQMLHAEKLEFTHPFTEKKMKLKAALPDDFSSLLKKLRAKG